MDNDTIRQYLNGDKVGEKYNGIKIKIFKELNPISKKELILRLQDWMKV